MRLATLALLAVFVGACAPSAPTSASTPADWADVADALSSEEYAQTFMDEFDTRLDAADAALADRQRGAVYQALYDGAEAQRAILMRSRDAGPERRDEIAGQLRAASVQTDATVEAVLTPAQVPVYRALQVEARALLARQVGGA